MLLIKFGHSYLDYLIMNFYSLKTDYFPVSHLASIFNLDSRKKGNTS